MGDRITELYLGELGDWDSQVTARKRVHWICSQVRGRRILDMGCSQGITALLLGREGFEVIGVDTDSEAITQAQRYLAKERQAVTERVKFLCDDAIHILETQGPFDSIIMGDLVEHLVRPGHAIEVARRGLSEGGVLVLTSPFGQRAEPGCVRPFHLGSFCRLLSGAWTPEEIQLVHSGIRAVAVPCEEGSKSAPLFSQDLMQLAHAEFVLLERRLIDTTLKAVERLGLQRQELAAAASSLHEAENARQNDQEAIESLKERISLLAADTAELEAELHFLRIKARDESLAVRSVKRSIEKVRDQGATARAKAEGLTTHVEWLRGEVGAARNHMRQAAEERSASQAEFDKLEHERAFLRKIRVRFDALLDRAKPAPGAPSARLEKLIERFGEIERMFQMVEGGVRRKIGDAIIRSLKPSLDTLVLPARLVSLFSEGSRKEKQRLVQQAKQRPVSKSKPCTQEKKAGAEIVLAKTSVAKAGDRANSVQVWPRSEPGRRVCVYAEVNPNLIDGSSVWLASLLATLGVAEDLRLTVLLGVPVRRPVILGHLLSHPRIRFVLADDLQKAGFIKGLASPESRKKLTPAQAAQALKAIDRLDEQALFIVRGPGIFEGEHVLDAVIAEPDLAARTWAYLVDPTAYEKPVRRDNLQRTFAACRRIVCQTEAARAILARQLKGKVGDPEQILVLPPMIPAVAARGRRLAANRGPRLGYAGKLSPPYRILETFSAFERIKAASPGAEFHVIGDKIHNAPPVEGFEEQVKSQLDFGRGVVWHGGVSRERTIELLKQVDLASSWRTAAFDESPELSTKVLEYAGIGLPVLLNPTELQRSLFGADYPGYVESEPELVEVFLDLTSDAGRYRQVSEHVREVAGRFTFDRVAGDLVPALLGDL